MRESGMRVGVVQSANKTTVYLFGYGVYDGDLEHPAFGIKNPHITLDDGGEVWGLECWWGVEEKVKDSIRGREVIIVKPWEDKEL